MIVDSNVPIPKFVSFCGALVTNFGNDKDTSNFILLVALLNPKLASERPANLCELRVRGTSGVGANQRLGGASEPELWPSTSPY